MPTLASVITASVVSGMISETEPTNVVLPAPKPPPTTILTEVIVGADRAPGFSKPTESTQNPFHQQKMCLVGATCRGLVHDDEAEPGHVADQNLGHAERYAEQRGDLGDRARVPAQRGHRPVFGGRHGVDVVTALAGGHQGLDPKVH